MFDKSILEQLPRSVIRDILEDPAIFALFAFDEWAYSAQRKIFKALKKYQRVAVYSANATGKSKATSWLIAWFANVFNPAIAVITAPTYEQIKRVLWQYLQNLFYKSRIKLRGKFLDKIWKIAPEHYVAPISPENVEAMQGIHGEHLLFVFDEASRVPDPIWEAVEGNLAGSDIGWWLVIGNPIHRNGRFYQTLFDPTFYKMRISAFDTPLFTGEINEIPEPYRSKLAKVLISPERVEEWKLRYGENSAVFKSRVLAEFPDDGEGNSVFSHSLIEKAFRQKGNPNGTSVISVDVARYGGDSSVIAIWRNFVCDELVEVKNQNFSFLAGKIEQIAKEKGIRFVIVDGHGLGQGLVDMLAELGNLEVISANYQASPLDKEKYADARTEMYFSLKELIESGDVHLPENQRLLEDLLAIGYEINRKGQLKIIDKDKIRKKLRRSPDFAEAVALRFWPHYNFDESPLIGVL